VSDPTQIPQADETDLYRTLGQELQELQEGVAKSSGLESVQAMTEGRESVGALINLGRSFFGRISSSAHDVLCGSSDASKDWKSLAGQGETALIGAISALLVAHLALVATVASAVAAIIVKLFFDAASKELCSRWNAATVTPSV
jgi:hypothetical protein